jgi:hypothetical protein
MSHSTHAGFRLPASDPFSLGCNASTASGRLFVIGFRSVFLSSVSGLRLPFQSRLNGVGYIA